MLERPASVFSGVTLESWRQRLERLFLGAPPPADVPQRIVGALKREQDQSEVLVSVMQLAAVFAFAVLYEIAPKTFSDDVPFEPVPIALGVYALFTCLRLWLAWRRRVTPHLVALSIIIDISLLMLLIWSFHLQYAQPPGIYIKAPTLMYAFILIALRALRAEPRFILLAGASAAFGWLVLVGYAISYDPTMKITRDYVEYMTSYRILIGAEMDKVISLMMVTIVLAIAMTRFRRWVFRAVADADAASELSRFFDPAVAQQITHAREALQPGTAERREATIMMVDLQAFTPYTAEHPPEDVMALLAEYQALVVPIINVRGGVIDKFLGDGILISFNAVRATPEHARAAFDAAEAIMDAATTWRNDHAALGRPVPALRVAIATGTVLSGAVGSGGRLEYTVIGEAVNEAAKLEKRAKHHNANVVAAVNAYRRARASGYTPQRFSPRDVVDDSFSLVVLE